jgi:Zn-dependent protease/predicted transcriptional regulator
MQPKGHIRLGQIGGIEIGLDFSWFIIAVLITFSLIEQFHRTNPQWGNAVIGSAAVITAGLFFFTLLLHELAHSLMAKRNGLRVRAITLFALGGVSQIESEAPDAKAEFWIAIVGPATSLAIGAILLALARAAGWASTTRLATPVTSVLGWLGYINLALAVFNLIPGYPLDGGRVLRAIIWWFNKSQVRATRAASLVGQVIAVLFILLGLYRFFLGANFGGLWIAFIGWFLLDAARGSQVQLELTTELRDRRVADLIEHDCAVVDGTMSLKEFIEDHLLRTARRCFIVTQNGRIGGLLTPSDVKKVSREDWERTSVQSVMLPLDQLHTVSPDTPALAALELMAREDLNQLPVVSDGHLDGIFSRAQVLRSLQLHSKLIKKSA